MFMYVPFLPVSTSNITIIVEIYGANYRPHVCKVVRTLVVLSIVVFSNVGVVH